MSSKLTPPDDDSGADLYGRFGSACSRPLWLAVWNKQDVVRLQPDIGGLSIENGLHVHRNFISLGISRDGAQNFRAPGGSRPIQSAGERERLQYRDALLLIERETARFVHFADHV